MVDDLSSTGKIRRLQGEGNIMGWIFDQLNGGIADLLQVKGADIT